MKKTNLLIKSATLALAVVLAGNIVAVGVDGKVVAKLTDNPLVISDIVNAAEQPPSVETPQQWSTAEVYKDARYGRTWSGTGSYGTQTRWEWLKDMNYVFTAEHAITENGTVLDYQYLSPIGLTCGGADETYMSHTDDNEPIRMYLIVWKDETLTAGEHLWESADRVFASDVQSNRVEIGNTYLEVEDTADYYRLIYNVTDTYSTRSDLKGFITYVEVKATGEIYGFKYQEDVNYYNDNRALTVIYSCLPVVPQN